MRFITKQSDCKLNKNTNCAHHPGNLHSKYYDRRDFGPPLLQYHSVSDPGFHRRGAPTTEGSEPASYLENVLPRTAFSKGIKYFLTLTLVKLTHKFCNLVNTYQHKDISHPDIWLFPGIQTPWYPSLFASRRAFDCYNCQPKSGS